MTNPGRLAIVVVALALPTHVRAERLTASYETRDCERDPACVAVIYADALVAVPREVRELRLDAIVEFERRTVRVYSAGRERIAALARSWQGHETWAVITVEGYADRWNKSEAAGIALAQRRADKVRGYLIRYGVAPEYVIAVGRSSTRADRAASGRVDLSIELHERSSKPDDAPAGAALSDLRGARRRACTAATAR